MANETPTREITIAGHQFTISQPYAPGHTINEAEARALNQTRAEAIRNNMAAKVKAAMAGEAKEGDPTADTIVQAVADYDAAYEFSIVTAGAGRRPSDPVEVEARRIARNILADFARDKGLTVKALREQIGDETYESKVIELAERPDTMKEAKRRVDVRVKQADSVLGDIDLGVSEEAVA